MQTIPEDILVAERAMVSLADAVRETREDIQTTIQLTHDVITEVIGHTKIGVLLRYSDIGYTGDQYQTDHNALIPFNTSQDIYNILSLYPRYRFVYYSSDVIRGNTTYISFYDCDGNFYIFLKSLHTQWPRWIL